MASPNTTAYLRPDLGMSFEEYDLVAELEGFVAAEVLPIFDAAVQNANFGKLAIEQLLKDVDTLRAPGGNYMRDHQRFEQDSFTTVEHGAEEPVDDRESSIYAHILDAELVAAQRARAKVLRALEQEVSAAVFNAATFTGALTTAVTNEWDDAPNATPISDVAGAMDAARLTGGILPNALVINWSVFNNLRQVAEIVERIKYWGGQSPNTTDITAQALAQALGIDRVIVAGGLRNTANEAQPAALGNIWSNELAMICRVPKSNDLREPCMGRLFHYTGDGSTPGATVEQYRDESRRSDIIRSRMDYHAKIIYPQAAHLLSNITT